MQYAKSPAGARGFMQVIPKYHYNGPVWHVYQIDLNLELGMKYLKYCVKKANGDLFEACRMYNAGHNSNRAHYSNWNDYVFPIMKNYIRSLVVATL